MSTHNICLKGELRKIFILIPHLSGAKDRPSLQCISLRTGPFSRGDD